MIEPLIDEAGKLNKSTYILQDDRRVEQIHTDEGIEEKRSTPHNYNGKTKSKQEKSEHS